MRRQIRGLKVGTENAEMGISWVQIGEGALNEAHDILHRMNELSIKAQNGTNTEVDRAYMEAEFEQLQSELDRISTTTTFNELNIFEEHEPVYDQICGNKKWDYEEKHEIERGKNQLIVEYRDTATSQQKTVTLTVPPGRYTTHELIDELDTAAGISGPIHMEYTEKGFCRVNLEGGEVIDSITGDLAYLLWDTYDGGGYGTLIGTTEFAEGYPLKIVQGKNDYMKFEIEYFDGSGTETVEIDLLDDKLYPPGYEKEFTKEEIMEIINKAVPADSGLRTSHHGDSIMLSSDLGIVTGFKGNMFTIENTNPVYNSVFYDNIQHGYVKQDPASVVGNAVLTTDTRDKEHNRFYIEAGKNDTLVLYPNPVTSEKTGPTTITISEKRNAQGENIGYTAAEMVAELNDLFQKAGIDSEVHAFVVTSGGGNVGDDKVNFQGVEIRTTDLINGVNVGKQGPDAIVNIDKDASTAYDTLFTIRNYNVYGTSTDAVSDPETKPDSNATATGTKTYQSGETVLIRDGINDTFRVTLTSSDSRNSTPANGNDYTKYFDIDILSGASQNMDADSIAAAINNQINNNAALAELKGRVVAEAVEGYDPYGNLGKQVRIRDYDQGDDGVLDDVNDASKNWNTHIELGFAGSNTGYRSIFQEEYHYTVDQTVTGVGSLSIDTGGRNLSGNITISINGTPTSFPIGGSTNAAGAAAAINKATPIKFTTTSSSDSTSAKNFSSSDSGTTQVINWVGGSNQGKTQNIQGTTKTADTPAQLEFGPQLRSSMTIDSTNNKITLALNGRKETLTIADGTYDQAGLARALQTAINNTYGTGMGGASVDIKNGRLFLTSILPPGQRGEKTSITAYGKGDNQVNTFFEYLNTEKTAASCTSNLWLSDSITLQDGVNDTFRFSYKDSSTGGIYKDVEIDVSNAAGGETISRDEFLDRIRKGMGTHKVDASIVDNRLVLTTQETGDGTAIRYTTGVVGNTDPNADAIFGGLSTATPARIILDKNVKGSSSTGGTFRFTLNNHPEEVTIGGWGTPEDLAQKLNDAFAAHKDISGNAAPLGVKASIVGGKLCLEKSTANGGNLSMSYDDGGTVMSHIFGYEPKPGLSVSASGNVLTIRAGKNDVISVSSNDGSGVVAKKPMVAFLTHDTTDGFHSAKYSTVTSTTLSAGGIVLTKWNNDLQFTFTDKTKAAGDQEKKVDIKLTESVGGVPTSLADIRQELQDKIDGALGAGVVEVVLKDNKISLKSARPGSQFQFSGMKSTGGNAATNKIGGGFFHHVMCGYTESKNQLPDPTDVNGEQFADNIFAQGRHDVVTELTKLKPGVSDTLILDLTFTPDPNENRVIDKNEENLAGTITLELKLDANMREEDFYNAEKLKEMIQRKLDEALEDPDGEAQKQAEQLGIKLHKGLIEVDVGRHDTNIWGNKDKVAISFNITKDPDIATPVEGFFYIDGIRGNAAYETFYHTEGELIPAYFIGTKNINDGVTLGPDNTELSFVVDDEKFTLKLEAGRYTAEGLVDTITQKFKEQNIPLAAEVTKDGFLKISHQRMGRHVIEKISGSARDELFYLEHADKRSAREREIRISSFEGDRLSVYSPRFSTSMLHINSLCLSQVKYAEKATNRLKEAIGIVSEMRNTFGAIQNRFEHTINNNLNKHENLQAAESRIRDADIAKEMMDFSGMNIIQQAGQAVMAQANQSREGLLQLLR